MSSGAKGAMMVSIPSSVKKMIENIKEITGQNHSEDEIYAMLKECSMDPNETTQQLLLLDTFHEVKRKRDRRKENLIKEPTESRWKPGTQARASKGSRGNYSSRYMSHDADGGKGLTSVKENATGHLSEKGISKAPLPTAQEVKNIETTSITSSPITAVSNDPSGITSQSTHDHRVPASGDVNQSNAAGMSKLDGPLPISSQVDLIRKPSASRIGDTHQHQILDSSNSTTSIALAPAAGSYSSSSDPLLFPSQDLPLPSVVGSVRREVGSRRTPVEVNADNPAEIKPVSDRISASEIGHSNFQQKMTNELHGVGKNQQLESLHSVSSVSRPSSNDNNRSQVIGPQKVGAAKEWKPKSTSPTVGQATAAVSSEVSPVSFVNYLESQPTPTVLASKEATFELQRKLEELHISDSQHVIIPNHLHVPETEKLWFRFGSFDANFNLEKSHNVGSESDQSQPLSEAYEVIDESVKELPLSNQNSLVVVEESEIKYPDRPQSPSQQPENFTSSNSEVPSSIIPDCNESKLEVAPGSHQHPAVQTSSNYNFGFMPPILSGQLSPLESSEAQARDAPRLPGFVVQQSFDPTSYYAQFYRSNLDSDGRISPFHPAVSANKYTGTTALVSAQTSQSPQEGGVSLVFSDSPTPIVTQAAGVMQSTVTATQQPLPVFRQPTGVHLQHFPPNYIPYSPYFSPFYVAPQAIHQFLSNGAFPQQPQAGSMYPIPSGTTAKYPVSQYKQGSNTGSSTQLGMPGSYGPYGLSIGNHTSSSATAAVSSTANEDLSSSQVKENNIYSEGSGVWFTTPGRDISTLQASSFYNLPQGQLAFTPTQPGHGTFPGIFHPAQAVTAATVHPLLQQSQAITSPVDMVGPPTHVYQQPQHAQLNWPSNY